MLALIFGILLFGCVIIALIRAFIEIKDLILKLLGKTKEIETFAYVIEVYPLSKNVQGKRVYNAKVLVFKENNSLEECDIFLGFKQYEYPAKSYVKVKYYNGQAEILQRVDTNSVSASFKEIIEKDFKF